MTRSYISENITHPADSSAKQFFQISLFLPLILPLIPLAASNGGNYMYFNGLTGAIGFFLMYSLFVGGVPYVLFLIGAFIWMRGKDADQVRLMTNLSPLLFSGVLVGCATVLGIVGAFAQGEPGMILGGLGVGLFLSLFAVAIGYAYVIFFNLAFVLYRWLTGQLEPDDLF